MQDFDDLSNLWLKVRVELQIAHDLLSKRPQYQDTQYLEYISYGEFGPALT
jgi:hypothetical protein